MSWGSTSATGAEHIGPGNVTWTLLVVLGILVALTVQERLFRSITLLCVIEVEASYEIPWISLSVAGGVLPN